MERVSFKMLEKFLLIQVGGECFLSSVGEIVLERLEG